MRFLTPFQYVAFASVPYSIPIWSSHIHAKVMTSYDTVTPNTPILLSHLHALYNIIILTFAMLVFRASQASRVLL